MAPPTKGSLPDTFSHQARDESKTYLFRTRR
jgi:hypothetical protein